MPTARHVKQSVQYANWRIADNSSVEIDGWQLTNGAPLVADLPAVAHRNDGMRRQPAVRLWIVRSYRQGVSLRSVCLNCAVSRPTAASPSPQRMSAAMAKEQDLMPAPDLSQAEPEPLQQSCSSLQRRWTQQGV